MRDDFRRILVQANRTNGAATLDTIAGALAALTEARAETAAQHLATLAFRFQGEDSFDLAARAYGLAAQASRARAAHYHLAAIRTGLVDRCRRQEFDGVEDLLEALRQAKAAVGDRGQDDPSLVQIAWDYELAGEAESAVRCYLLARIARDTLGGRPLTVDGDTLERKIRNLRSLQMTALAEAGRHAEAQALHERTRTTLGLGPVRIYDIMSARQAAATGRARIASWSGPAGSPSRRSISSKARWR